MPATHLSSFGLPEEVVVPSQCMASLVDAPTLESGPGSRFAVHADLSSCWSTQQMELAIYGGEIHSQLAWFPKLKMAFS